MPSFKSPDKEIGQVLLIRPNQIQSFWHTLKTYAKLWNPMQKVIGDTYEIWKNHTAYRDASLINQYLYTNCHCNRKTLFVY